MNISVVTVGNSMDALAGDLEALHGPVTVVRRCADLAELIAACQSGLARAAIVAENVAELNVTLVDRLATVGVVIVALTDDAEQVDRLRRLGVLVAAEQSEVSALSAQIVRAVSQAGQTVAADRYHHLGFAAPGQNASMTEPVTGVSTQEQLDAGHRLIAVWGPVGSPGRTTIAVNLAAELACAGKSVLLIDADSYGASIAATIGLLDESAAIAQAYRLADQGKLDQESLRRIAPELMFRGGKFRVLTGLTRADRWPELRSSTLSRVLETARTLCDVVVVDCGLSLEADEELSFDALAPRRNAATLTVVAAADEVLAVGTSDSIGIPRLVRALQDLDAVAPGQQVTVVLNKVRASAAGRHPERALQQAWDRFGPEWPVAHYLPWDPQSIDRALLAGEVLLEAAPESELRRRIQKIVGADAQRNRKYAVPSTIATWTDSGYSYFETARKRPLNCDGGVFPCRTGPKRPLCPAPGQRS